MRILRIFSKLHIILLLIATLEVFLIILSRTSPLMIKQTDKKLDEKNIFQDDTALYMYVKTYGLKNTMKHLADLEPTQGDCHQQAHKAGRFGYELTKEKAFSECIDACHSGCYHGTTESFFNDRGTENLAENIKLICPSGYSTACIHSIHGIGHGLMAWTDYEIFDALKSCDLIPSFKETCYTGIFMENIVGGLQSEATQEERVSRAGHFTTFLNTNPHYPCTIVNEKYKSSCYFYQTSRMVQLLNYDFSKVAAECLKAPKEYYKDCFESMGRDVSSVNRTNPKNAVISCEEAPDGTHRLACHKGILQDMFWDKTGKEEALLFCGYLNSQQEQSNCYTTLIVRAKELFDKQSDLVAFCNQLPQQYQKQCLYEDE